MSDSTERIEQLWEKFTSEIVLSEEECVPESVEEILGELIETFEVLVTIEEHERCETILDQLRSLKETVDVGEPPPEQLTGTVEAVEVELHDYLDGVAGKDGDGSRDNDKADEPKDPSSGDELPDTVTKPPGEYDQDLFFDFFNEASQHLETFEEMLFRFEDEPNQPEAVQECFRAMHSIKGAAGFMNFGAINRLSHTVENLLDRIRDGYRMTDSTVEVLFEALDRLKELLNLHHRAVESEERSDESAGDIENLLTKLEQEIENLKEPRPDGETETSEPSESGAADSTELEETDQFRVRASKVDELITSAGELVTTFNQLNRKGNGDHGQREIYGQMERIVSELQERALSMRMIPLDRLFRRIRKLVRDLKGQFDKQVQFEIEGEDTELDRNMVEKIQDPLVHLVRNALDHGIEPPDERRQQDKDPTGTLTVRAYHQSGDVVIEVSDDGRGLDREGILEKARRRDLIAGDGSGLTDNEVYELIMEPGFSTREEVTDVSGRGVGMDVVRKNVNAVQGQIEVESNPGEGTTVRLNLPLTLSIINGMVVRVRDERYVVPLTHIRETLSPDRGQINTVKNRGEMINLRGDLIRTLRLNRLFRLGGKQAPLWESLLVIVGEDEERVGIEVDELVGQQEVVIKTLGPKFDGLRGISGASILGDGSVGLILDAKELIQLSDVPTPRVNGEQTSG